MKKIAVLTGAGISAESGISTFRDSDGLWENYNVEDVASIDGWYRNPELMIQFYNERRAALEHCQPNEAHRILAELEQSFDITVITQNIDNLHERAGSSKIIHLHGEATKVCSENGKCCVKDIGYKPIQYGDRAEDGHLLRPFIVWFGEAVPMLEPAIDIVQQADIMIVIGTSLVVYPAAGLINYTQPNVPIYVVDPKEVQARARNVEFIQAKATEGMRILKEKLLTNL